MARVQREQTGSELFGRHFDQFVGSELEQVRDFRRDARVVYSVCYSPTLTRARQVEPEVEVDSHVLLAHAFGGADADDALYFEGVDQNAVAVVGHGIRERSLALLGRAGESPSLARAPKQRIPFRATMASRGKALILTTA